MWIPPHKSFRGKKPFLNQSKTAFVSYSQFSPKCSPKPSPQTLLFSFPSFLSCFLSHLCTSSLQPTSQNPWRQAAKHGVSIWARKERSRGGRQFSLTGGGDGWAKAGIARFWVLSFLVGEPKVIWELAALCCLSSPHSELLSTPVMMDVLGLPKSRPYDWEPPNEQLLLNTTLESPPALVTCMLGRGSTQSQNRWFCSFISICFTNFFPLLKQPWGSNTTSTGTMRWHLIKI